MNLLAEFARLRRATPMSPAEVAAVKQERVEEEKKKLAERPPAIISTSTVPINLEVGQEASTIGGESASAVANLAGTEVPSPLLPRSITSELELMKVKVPAALLNAPGKSSLPAEEKKRKREVEKKKGKKEEKRSNAGEKKALPAPGDVVIFSGKNLPPKKLPLPKVPLGVAPAAGAKDKASSSKTPQEVFSLDFLPVVERQMEKEGEYFCAVNSALQLENAGSEEDKARAASKARWMSERDLSVERRFSKMEAIMGVLMSDVALLKSGYFFAGGQGEGYLGGDESEALKEQSRRGRRAEK